jgi:hypothetical protein
MMHPTILQLLRVFIAMERVYQATAWQCYEGYILPSHCLATMGRTHIQTHRLMGGIYEACHYDGLICHNTHIKFHKGWFRHLKVDGGGEQRHTDRMENA